MKFCGLLQQASYKVLSSCHVAPMQVCKSESSVTVKTHVPQPKRRTVCIIGCCQAVVVYSQAAILGGTASLGSTAGTVGLGSTASTAASPLCACTHSIKCNPNRSPSSICIKRSSSSSSIRKKSNSTCNQSSSSLECSNLCRCSGRAQICIPKCKQPQCATAGTAAADLGLHRP